MHSCTWMICHPSGFFISESFSALTYFVFFQWIACQTVVLRMREISRNFRKWVHCLIDAWPSITRYNRLDEFCFPLPSSLSILNANSDIFEQSTLEHSSEVSRYWFHRYTGGDLAQLVLEAGVICIRDHTDLFDLEEDELPLAQMRKIRIRQKDLLQAMGNTNPSSLREKSVEVRTCPF